MIIKKIALFIFQICIWFPISFLVTALTSIIVIIGCNLNEDSSMNYYPGMLWSKCICKLSLCKINLIGKENLNKKNNYIFIANHQSAFDIFLIYGYLGFKIKWVMMDCLKKMPLIGRACKAAGFIFIDQSSPKSTQNAFEQIKKNYCKGYSIVIFPEGCRSLNGQLNTFKKGAFNLAYDLNATIIPLTINGTIDVLHPKSYFINPGMLELVIHPPIVIKHGSSHKKNKIISSATLQAQHIINSKLWEKYKPTV